MREEDQTKNETGGLSFAVTLLAALGTILYASYTYLQTLSVDSLWYFFICGLFSIAVILVFCLLLYILIKGYSIEVDNHERKRSLNKKAAFIYLIVFPVCTALLSLFLCIYVFTYLDMKYNLATHLSYRVIGLITWGAAFFSVLIIFGNFLEDIKWFDKIINHNKIINQSESRWMKKIVKSLMTFLIFLIIAGIFYVIWFAMFSIIIT
jgi:MFS family permease